MTDDKRFWDAVCYIAETPDPERPNQATLEYQLVIEARMLMKSRVAEINERSRRAS